MKAFVCKEFGPIESHGIEEVPDPIAGDGQVVVDIKATGISFPDQKSLQNTDWGFSPGGLTRKNKTPSFPKNLNSRIRFQTG